MRASKFVASALAFLLLFAAWAPRFAVAADMEHTVAETSAESPAPDNGENGENGDGGDAVVPPAAFYIEVMRAGNGVKIRGFFPGYTSDMQAIQSLYSLDGETFYSIEEGEWEFSEEIVGDDILANNVANQNQSPLKEYLEKTTDTFYIRLQYETEAGVQVSQTARFDRPTEVVSTPEGVLVQSMYPRRMQQEYVGQYHLTVREGATREDVLALLPDALPVELQVLEGSSILALMHCEGGAEWSLPDELTPDVVKVENAVADLTMPEDLQIETLNAIYAMPTIDHAMPLDLTLNWVGAEEKTAFSLYAVEDGHANYPPGTLFLTLPLKPSGATAVVPSYSLDGGETWTQTEDLLTYNEAIDAWPRNPDYRYAALFAPNQSPYQEYLSNELDGFLVRLDITGGTLAGQSETVAWPMDYEYQPPAKDNGDNGSGGNGGNIGSDNTDGNSSSNGGQRPGLADDKAEEVVPAPTPDPAPVLIHIPMTALTPASTSTPVPAPEPAPVLPTPTELAPTLPMAVVSVPTPEPPKAERPEQNPLPEETTPPTAEPTVQPTPTATQSPEPAEVPVKKPLAMTEPAPAPASTEEHPEIKPDRQSPIPVAAVAVTLVAGGGIAVCAGASSAGAAGTGAIGKLMAALKRFFMKK